MNFLCHALPTMNRSPPQDVPVLAICTGMPDFLSVIDRRIRVRRRTAEPFLDSPDPVMRNVAAGIVTHVADDRWFHGGATFARLNLEFAVQLRDRLPGDAGFRPSFVGHILIEMLLDANYAIAQRCWVDRYYHLFQQAPLDEIEACVNRITGKPSDRIADTLRRFATTQFLYDYTDDTKLLMRLNQVMARVGLDQLPEAVQRWLPEARAEVRQNHDQLLSGSEKPSAYPPL
ncbi:hypothetical protein [Allorhodopirellula heiligendammensis]|uniref:Phospholipase C/D domain-containing protein n=1 Tax=Allorhodopirellula heiligendammensis TaxID=2714739 RepID=A0A5C6BTX5_9BACT|nr:hypothetical protein [Allorhodopirellula heiligendammensis]TWU15127.1 hypothetical protein Poly21_23190 [Allorhodopirellula heiligendammensis]|tara:strand:+ start:3671 stop:4363 length:693 start_codon:yes stop_codon:yes gene_type:complete